MCLCNGTGGIQIQHRWGIQFEPCPDTNCTHDKEKSRREYEEWRERFFRESEEMRRNEYGI